jgi:hypothetical protein
MPSRIRRFTRSLRRALASAERFLVGGDQVRFPYSLAKRNLHKEE